MTNTDLTARQFQSVRMQLVDGKPKSTKRKQSKRKALKDTAPAVVAMVPALLDHTRSLDSVAAKTDMRPMDILLQVLLETRRELREMRRGSIHAVPRFAA